jgi:hypothetical protein
MDLSVALCFPARHSPRATTPARPLTPNRHSERTGDSFSLSSASSRTSRLAVEESLFAFRCSRNRHWKSVPYPPSFSLCALSVLRVISSSPLSAVFLCAASVFSAPLRYLFVSFPVEVCDARFPLDAPADVCYMYTCYQISIRIAPRLAREKPLASHFALSPHPPQIRPIRATLLISIASTLFCTLFLETLCLQCVPQNNRGYTPFRKMSTPLQTDHLAPPRCHSPTPLR